MVESEDLFAESNGIQGNQKIQRQKKAKPILPRTCTRMSSLVEPKLARKDDILDHDDARTNGGEKIVESSDRIGLPQKDVGCNALANSEYLSRHNRAPMIMTFAWAKEYKLIRGDMVWYKERWERGMVLESKREKLVWDFKFHLYKATTVRRPYLTLEDKAQERIWICNMACHQQ